MNEKLKKKISGKGFVFGDRLIAIIVVVVVSGISFALGYFVGGATGRGVAQLSEAPSRVVEPLTPIQPVTPQPLAQQTSQTQPQIVIVNDTGPEQAQIANELAALPPDEEAYSPAPVMKPKSAETTAAKKEPAPKAPATKEPSVKQEVAKLAAEKAEAVKPAPEAKSAALFTVQIGAFKAQSDADALKKRMSDKGYSAFVQKSGSKSDSVPYKVRVGSFKDKKDAELMSARLGKAESLKCFITHKD